ncbi:hypothetical protein [Actinomadura madurae]|uniref:hypothetical protein n=1 Tax=Actinomadura madurae TaxID=1993 RepID=UPI0020D22876|nr:hypothetical protein [Actinomadura madurae]MCQ0016229.1 hypothetical protein [Actinomadura madurae]
MEEVRAVAVHLDARLRLGLAVGVSADVAAPVEHEDAQAEVGRASFGDRETEESGAGHHEINVHWTVPIRLVRGAKDLAARGAADRSACRDCG